MVTRQWQTDQTTRDGSVVETVSHTELYCLRNWLPNGNIVQQRNYHALRKELRIAKNRDCVGTA